MLKALTIAGTHSGSGKTSVALGLMAAFRRRGLVVHPYKVGPDFIDPSLHTLAAGQISQNLDGWMMGRDGVLRTFQSALAGADIAVIEGVMGLFDGASGQTEEGSTAQIAKWLGAPVALVVDCRAMARSAAALVQGYAGFDPDLNLAGVIFNRVGSPNHRELLAEAMRVSSSVEVLGFLDREPGIELPSRHLGLVTAADSPLDAGMLERLADWIERGLDLDRLLQSLPALALPPTSELPQPRLPGRPVRIGLATDRAFCFYYPENLRCLERAGATLVPFSPLADSALPQALDGLYLGGGYPELYAPALAANHTLRAAVLDFSRSGKPVYAECGGFMYLMQGVENDANEFFPLTGVFDFRCRMDRRLSALGYREVVIQEQSPLGPAGTRLRGHEFHYSHLAPFAAGLDAATRAVYKLRDRKGWLDAPEGFMRHNTLGSYVHLHFGATPEAAAAFVAACIDAQS